VPSAAIFDLNLGNGAIRPDAHMGRRAAAAAATGPIAQGSLGVGAGATVGKLFGIAQAMKSGVGSASVMSGDLIVGALVVVNAYGDVTDPQGTILAGCRTSADSLKFADSVALLREGKARSRRVSVENTTLSVVAVNARMDKISASRIAVQATLGLGCVIRPFHSQLDGDLTIVLGAGDIDADHSRIALLASEALQRSVIKAISAADGLGLITARQDLGLATELLADI
jgi:L-aminopeptidase/D-esterase-like protein